MQAAQAYFACEKNEMMAANFLFENAESLREEMEEGLMAPGGGGPTAPPQIPLIPAPGSGPRPMPGPPLIPGLGSAPTTLPAPGSVPAPGTAPPTEAKKEEKSEDKKEEKEEGSSLQLDDKPEEKKP